MSERETGERERQWLRRIQVLEQEICRHAREEEQRGQELLDRLSARKATHRLRYEEAIQRFYEQAAGLRAEAMVSRIGLQRLRSSWFYRPFALLLRIEEAIRRRLGWTVRPATGAADAADLRFDIDTLRDCIVRGRGDLSGWLLRLQGAAPRAVRARSGGLVFDGVYGISRPDIGLGFPDVPGAGQSGFRVGLELPEGTHEVALEARYAGEDWREFARVPVLSMALLPPEFHYWLDSPRTYRVGLCDGEEFTVAGWCVPGIGGRVHGIRLLLNETAHPGEHGLPRPDVARLLPDVPFAANGGFLVRARVEPGRYRGHIQAKDGTGAWQDVAVHDWHIFMDLAKPEELSAPVAMASLPAAEAYQAWHARTRAGVAELERQRQEAASWQNAPLLSVVIPSYNSRPGWFAELIDSLRGQTYPRFECLIVDDASTQKSHLDRAGSAAREDPRFRVIEHRENLGVGGATRTGADASIGDYVLVVDHDDVLEPDALFEIAGAIRGGGADVVYTDEVLVSEAGSVFSAALRPAFSYDYLLSHPYIVHLTAVRRELVIASGSFDARLPVSQDYDLLLRVAALTRKFHHVPKALYRWRIHGTSTGHRQAGLVMQISRAALQRHLRLVGGHAAGAWVEDGPVMNTFRVRYPVAPAKVAVVVVGGGTADARECLRAFWEQTRFPEGVVADVTVVAPPEKIGAELRRLEYRVVELASDSGLAAQLNAAAGQTQGEHLLFLDAGAIPADENWLQALIEPLAQPDVAAVGAKLVNPRTGLIEHAGAIVGFDGSVGMEHRGFPEKEGGLPFPGHGHGLAVIRDCSALSGACLMVRRRSFTAAGGFDPEYAGAFHDFDLALRLRAGGQRVVFTPYARLFWEGSAAPTGADLARFGARWSEAIRAGDPFYSPNLARAGKMFWPAD